MGKVVCVNAEKNDPEMLAVAQKPIISFLIVVFLVAAAMVMTLQPVRSPDVWHHAASGRLVLEEGGPARADVFSHTANGKRWIQYEWLAQVIIFLSWKTGGVAGLHLLRLATVATAALLFFLAARARRAGAPAAALAVGLALYCLSPRFFTRPELFTWVLFGALILVVEHLRRGRHRLALVPALVIVPWVNMHGAWIAGLAWMGLVCGGDTIAYLLKRRNAPSKRTVVVLWLALVAAFVATLLNPYGLHIWEVPFALSASAVVKSKIVEWKPVTLNYLLRLRHLGIFILLTSLIVAWRGPDPAEWLVMVFFGWLSTRAVRHPPFALLVVCPILASQLELSWKEFRFSPRLRRALARRAVQIPCAAGGCIILTVLVLGAPELHRPGWGLQKDKFPSGAVEFIRTHKLHGNLYNTYDFGNLLMFDLYPQNLVFIDGRVDMYGEEVVRLYDRLRTAQPGWGGILKQHNIEMCVVKTSDRTDELLVNALHESAKAKLEPERWALVYWDDLAAVYVQRTPDKAKFLGETYVYAIPPNTPTPEMLQTPDGLEQALKDYEHKLEENPNSLLAWWGRAECLRRTGDLAGAIESYEEAAELSSRHLVLHFHLGSCLIEAGRLDAAEKVLLRTMRLAARQREDKEGIQWRVLLALSLLHERRGAIDKAIDHVQRVLDLMPDNQTAANRLQEFQRKQLTPGRR